MWLETIGMDEANALLDRHYLGPVTYRPYVCFATPERDALAVYSPPVASHFKKV